MPVFCKVAIALASILQCSSPKKTIFLAGVVVQDQFLRRHALGGRLKRMVVTGTKIYLALAVFQFMLGLLFGGGLVLLGYDLADAAAILRGMD